CLIRLLALWLRRRAALSNRSVGVSLRVRLCYVTPSYGTTKIRGAASFLGHASSSVVGLCADQHGRHRNAQGAGEPAPYPVHRKTLCEVPPASVTGRRAEVLADVLQTTVADARVRTHKHRLAIGSHCWPLSEER